MPTAEQALNEAWKIHQSGDVPRAERMYAQVINAFPSHAAGWCYLGMALHDLERYDEAVAAYQRAIRLQPSFPIAFNNLGNTQRQLRRLSDAVASYNRAIELKPDYVTAFKNKATTLVWEGHVEESLKTYEAALPLAPDDAEIHKHIGILRLLLGDYAGGWPEYEWRWKTKDLSLPAMEQPLWDGSSLDGKTILLTPEQGLGDTIQFIRYAAWLKEHYDCRVLFHCPRVLRELLATCEGIDEWVDNVADPPRHDVYSPLVQVAGVLRHGLADFPARIPYLKAEPQHVEQWRKELAPYPGRKIGIAWRGSPIYHADRMRSFPLAEFGPLGKLKGLQLFSLQKGKGSEELETIVGRLDIVDLGKRVDETTGAFIETAAVLKNLDLLITADTSVAHVAGALGVPVWLAVSNVADWRWLNTGETTVWYPSMRIFRQSTQGGWAGVFERIAAALEKEFPDLESKHYRDYRLTGSGFNQLTRAKDGLVLYNRHDTFVGRSIERYGEFSPGERELFAQVIKPGAVIVEAGANIGAHTLLLSRLAGEKGAVFAFEPQRLAFQTLCANVALNSLTNVYCRDQALGEAPGTIRVPTLDPNRDNNFGGLALGGAAGEVASVITLDSLNLKRCDFLKVDVEGMELAVLKGAAQTIARQRPILYVENDRRERSPELLEHLLSLGYNLFWHTPALFSGDNYFRNPTNDFGNVVSINVLAIHSSINANISGLRRIEGPQSDWRQRSPGG
jgi:FkbM family methyltransferase